VRDFKASRRIVLGEVSRLQNAILNLAVNARDVMPEGGSILISTFTEDGTGVEEGRQFINISVRDTGPGIPPDIVDRIFEPFFTTKDPGKGTGLGLATVYGTATAMGGKVSVISEPGSGAEFIIRLPLSSSELSKPLPRAASAPAQGKGCVLVIDDEDAVRLLLRDVLCRFGYRVLTAPDADKGLEVFRRERRGIDLVILDVVLPGMPAVKAFHEMRSEDPKACVLFISGMKPDPTVSELVSSGSADFLQKPFVSGDLVGKLVKLQGLKK
jgi:CheY-like chemotaxis protein